MKLKTLAQSMLVSCGLVLLTSCAALHKDGSDDVATPDGGGPAVGAQTAGIGDDSSFDGQGGSRGKVLGKRTYYFQFDKSEVQDSDKPAIFANADNLVAHSRTKVLLEGHTDPRGSREYNVALGERRAKAVSELLKSKGVNPSQVRVMSYGAERLAVPGHNEEDYQQDRRVVLVYLR